jgi:serine phosphatase RsbU (regulator of sigma subunit)/PAS domain-containing protein
MDAEIRRLREAMAKRAIVEQATGLLAGQLNVRLSTAFENLGMIAQQTGTTVSEAAYLLLHSLGTDETDLTLPSSGKPDTTIFSREAVLSKAKQLRATGTPTGSKNADRPDLERLADLIPLPAIVLTPLSDDDGNITDFTLSYGNNEARFVGGNTRPTPPATLLQVFPDLATSGLIPTYAHAVRTGAPVKLDLFPFQGMVEGEYRIQTVDIRAQPHNGQLLVTWRTHDAASERARRVADAERLGHIGWAEWNLYSDEVTWSYELYAMHGRDLADGPLTLDAYREVVHPDDLDVIEGLLRGLTERAEDTEVEFRIRTRDGELKDVRVSATTIADPEGNLFLLRGVFQDVTSRRRTERELSEATLAVERAMHDATLKMQDELIPPGNTSVNTKDYQVSVRYVSADGNVGGDWYEARVRADGSLFIAVGDVSGHGLPAAAGMARVSNALRGLSVTDLDVDQMLSALNKLVCQTEDIDSIASAIAGTLQPGARMLRWAQAGHPNPTLIRNGTPLLLDRPDGKLLGTDISADYEVAELELREGDLLLWFTDGLIEHRQLGIDEGLARLHDALLECSTACAEEFLDELLAKIGPLAGTDDVCVLAARVH